MAVILSCFSASFTYAKSLQDLINSGAIGGSVTSSVVKPSGLPGFENDSDNAVEAAQSVFFRAIDMILLVAGVLSVIFIMIGGFIYVINAGQEDMQTKAKATIMYAIIGLLVVFISYAVVENTIRYIYNQVETENYNKLKPLDEAEFVDTTAIDPIYNEEYPDPRGSK